MRAVSKQHQIVGVRVEGDVGEDRVVIVVGQLVVVEIGIVEPFARPVFALPALDGMAHLRDAAVEIGRVHARLGHDELDQGRQFARFADPLADRGKGHEVAAVALVAVDLEVAVLEVIQELRMNALDVIALVEGIDRGLPVAVPFDRPVSNHHHALEVIGIEVRRQRSEEVVKRLRFGVQGEPHEASPGVAVELGQAVAGRPLGEGLAIRNTVEPAVELIFPVMVGAPERLGGPHACRHQSIAAMLAHVVEGPHAVVGLAHEKNGLEPDLVDEIVAGPGNVILAARHQPHLGPHARPFSLHEFRAV